jgi:hypothetical protein
LIFAVDHPDVAIDIAAAGRITANEYTYTRFRELWVRELHSFFRTQN